MLLTFIGKGSCFNTDLGNNSAYYKAGSSLLLFDCGCDVFSKLKKSEPLIGSILDGVSEIAVVVTHLHDDNIGSLGSFIAYCKYVLQIQVKVLYPNESELSDELFRIGVRPSMYDMLKCRVNNQTGLALNGMEVALQPIETKHYRGMSAYGYSALIDGTKIYYSGDSAEIPGAALILLTLNRVSEFYQDISGRPVDPNEYWPHLQYEDLLNVVSLEFRDKVFLMHQDEEFMLIQNDAKIDGFGVV